MLRPTQMVFRQASRRVTVTSSSTTSSIPSIITRFSSTSNSCTDYEQIMQHRNSPSRSYASASSSSSSSEEVIQHQQQQTMRSNLYRSVEEPSRFEDYDAFELHCMPSEKTLFTSYYNASWDPSGGGGESGSIV
mmetsp:Transcript_15909/g.34399  ORF Transcript_15909/g.34399 Transcript_15909/m.34399 type:complete len:134 (+) Transcript_15909:2295-2696(+)